MIRFRTGWGLHAFGALTAFVLAACGSSQQAQPAPKTAPGAAVQNAPPPLPQEPLRLLPIGVRELLSVNLRELRASPHFAIAEQWLRRYACLQAEPSHFLLERTERAVLATYDAGPSGQGPLRPLAVLRGEYRAGDVERALSQVRALLSTAPEPVSQQQRGRFVVFTAGELAGVQLGEHLIAVGHPERVLAALEVAEARQANWNSAEELMRGLNTEEWLARNSVAAITRVDARTARSIGKQLSFIGGRRLGEDLSESSAALAVVLARDLQLQAHVLYADAGTAAHAADGLRSVLGRADLVLRLTGMPSALDHAQVEAQGEQLNASLKLSASELQALSERLLPLLDSGTPTCGALSAAPPAAGTAGHATHASPASEARHARR